MESADVKFNYNIDITKLTPYGNATTLIRSNNSEVDYYLPSYYGAGITITSLYYNIFFSVRASFVNPP